MRTFPALLLAATLSLGAEDHTPVRAKAAPPTPTAPTPDRPDSPSAALAELSTGNGRFVTGKRTRTLDTGRDPALRASLLGGQAPFAVILTCADSRVPDALIFDQEAGRLFTIREAGNAPDLQGLASVEYAVAHLGSKVVVLMGHTRCGAVKAIREANGQPLPGNLWSLQAGMAGLLESTPQDPNEDDQAHLGRLEAANARRQAQALLDRSPLLREAAQAERLWIVPALYHLDTGKVQFFKPLSAQAAPATGAAHH